VTAMKQEDYDRWLSGSTTDLSMSLRGRQLFLKHQCVACHSSDSQARAPVLENLYLRTVVLSNGDSWTADDNYLRESIRLPKAKIVAGFQPIMPTFGEEQMSEEELQQVVAFIKTLRAGQTPARNERMPAPEAKSEAKGDKP